jgi:S-formylglutathione hydrolase FrmB
MGGYGTIKLAMRNPGLFKTAYALSPANLVNELVVLGSMKSFLMQAVNASSTDGLSWQAMTTVAQAAAFAPDPEAGPFYGQFPVTPSGILIDSVWQKWLKHDPYTMIPAYKDSLLKLDAIQFDCGKSDKYLYTANIHFSIALTEHGINHVFKSYDGDHVNKISERVTFYLLPFFSEHLKHDNTE